MAMGKYAGNEGHLHCWNAWYDCIQCTAADCSILFRKDRGYFPDGGKRQGEYENE